MTQVHFPQGCTESILKTLPLPTISQIHDPGRGI